MLNDIAPDERGGCAPERGSRVLREIAALLGCSIEDLSGAGGLARELVDTTELLRLWCLVPAAPTRRAVIEHLKTAAGEA